MSQADAVTALLQILGVQPLKAGAKTAKKGKSKTKKKGGREKLTDAEKAVFIAQNDAGCVAAFTKAGYKDVQPRVNVMTYKKFIASGRMVRKGEKATRVGPFNLFHVDQTDPLPVEQKGAPTVPAANAEAPATVQ